jgi:hypothetical protein
MALDGMRMSLPLTLILVLAAIAVGTATRGSQKIALQKRRVAARGHLTGTREVLQVITWQTPNPQSGAGPYGIAHLAVETSGRGPLRLWQTDGGQEQYLVDSVRLTDLDGDRVPEIVSLWWVGAKSVAALRVFGWDKEKQSFIEARPSGDLQAIYRYGVLNNPSGAGHRLVVYVRSEVGAGSEYELRGSEIVRARGARQKRMEDGKQTGSGVEGVAVIGPTRPVVRENDQGSDTRPYETDLVIVTAGERREVARLRTGSDGRFRVSLPPGEYLVKAASERQAKFAPRAAEHLVKVQPGQIAFVTVLFDTGIR